MAEYIEREAAYGKCGWYNTVNGKSIYAATKGELASVPSADVEPVRHGYWIKDAPYRDEEGYIIQQFYCSECGRYEDEKEPYCNCGCKMDLEENSYGFY